MSVPSNLTIAKIFLVIAAVSFTLEFAASGFPMVSGVCLVLAGIVYGQEAKR